MTDTDRNLPAPMHVDSLSLSGDLIARGLQHERAVFGRTVHFPTDRSLGSARMVPLPINPFLSIGHEEDGWNDARGVFEVPPGNGLFLHIDAPDDWMLPTVVTLDPYDLAGLWIQWVGEDYSASAWLDAIVRLRGLLSLEMDGFILLGTIHAHFVEQLAGFGGLQHLSVSMAEDLRTALFQTIVPLGELASLSVDIFSLSSSSEHVRRADAVLESESLRCLCVSMEDAWSNIALATPQLGVLHVRDDWSPDTATLAGWLSLRRLHVLSFGGVVYSSDSDPEIKHLLQEHPNVTVRINSVLDSEIYCPNCGYTAGDMPYEPADAEDVHPEEPRLQSLGEDNRH